MLIDAAGNEVPSDRCLCGRHKLVGKDLCCPECPVSVRDGFHNTTCQMRQEHFPDTRRGVVATEFTGEAFKVSVAASRRRGR